MKALIYLTLLIMVGACVATIADAAEERVVTVSPTGFRFTYGSAGPRSIDVAVDGKGYVTFFWLKGGTGTDAGDTVRKEPIPSTGNGTAFYLNSAYPPRNFQFGADGPDSCLVILTTATEAVVTWE